MRLQELRRDRDPTCPINRVAKPHSEVVEISFTGVDYGYDGGVGHYFGRSLTLDQLKNLEVLLVYDMNGQPLLPQHGAPLRIIVPGWYGMASVKWLNKIEALTEPFQASNRSKLIGSGKAKKMKVNR